MTKRLLVFAALLTSSALSAQIVAFVGDTNSVVGSVSLPDNEISVSWDVINISGSSRQISCRREMVQEVPGSSGRFCWGETCSAVAAGDLLLNEVVSMNAGDTSTTFHGYYRHNGNPGLSIARFIWFDVNASFNQVAYDVYFCVDYDCTLGTDEVSQDDIFEIIGNPLSELSAFKYDFRTAPSNGELLIYDASGKLIQTEKITSAKGLILIDSGLYSSGVYTCLLREDGRTKGTQRLVVSK
jgi:hypothetical protein